MTPVREAGASVVTAAGAPRCPDHGDSMVLRHGQRGDFYGCRLYPDCRTTASATARGVSPRPAPAGAPPEAAGPTGDLITDLRRAAGHLGAAVDILRRRAPQLDALLSAPLPVDDDDPVPF